MSQEYIEVTEKTLDDAITTACQKLSVTSDRLDYMIVEKGSNGFLGFNARPYVIKARIKDAKEAADKIMEEIRKNASAAVEAAAKAEKPENSDKPAQEPVVSKKISDSAAEKKEEVKSSVEEVPVKNPEMNDEKDSHRKNRSRNRNRNRGKNRQEMNYNGEETSEVPVKEAEKPEGKRTEAPKKKEEKKVHYSDEIIAAAQAKAKDFLVNVFAAMKMDVQIETSFDKEENIMTVNMIGDDMGVLIGKRGQTLDSLQYLVSLIVNEGVEGYIHVKADTENYRERRKKTLENLAKNIAFKVKRNRKPVTLEPMNPYERRIIHSALQNDHYVTTYSVGEEPYRKVVVAPKK